MTRGAIGRAVGRVLRRLGERLGLSGPRALDVRPPAVAVAVGLVALLVGLRAVDALLAALVVLGAGLVAVTARAGDHVPWPVHDPAPTDGARPEISALTWSFTGRDGRVTEAAVRRLRGVALHRLARAGLHGVVLTGADPVDPLALARREEARDLLGERAWAALTSVGGWLPSLADVEHCVDVLERLVPPRPERTRP